MPGVALAVFEVEAVWRRWQHRGVLAACGRLVRLRDWNGFSCRVFFLLDFVFVLMVHATHRPLGRAGTSTPRAPTVSRIDRKMVGVFETTTIPRATGGGTRLAENQRLPPPGQPRVKPSQLRQRRMGLCGANIRRDDPDLQTADSASSFITVQDRDKAVYPMRLTGIDNGPLQAELYVFWS